MAEINDLTIVDASNIARFPELQAPSTVNNGARALEGMVARWHRDTNGSKASTGSANAYVFAADQTLSAYYDGLTITFDANFTNTGAATLNVDAVSADAIVWPDGTALVSGDIASGAKVTVRHDGTSWQLVSGGTAVLGTAATKDITGLSEIELVRKAADETVNNSTTLQDDDEIVAALAANENVHFQLHLRINSGTTPDLKIAFTVPSGATVAFTAHPSGSTEATGSGTSLSLVALGANQALSIVGHVANGATPGNLQLQWAQNTSDVSDSKVLSDSYLIVWRE
jgi:hypothetical protein